MVQAAWKVEKQGMGSWGKRAPRIRWGYYWDRVGETEWEVPRQGGGHVLVALCALPWGGVCPPPYPLLPHGVSR